MAIYKTVLIIFPLNLQTITISGYDDVRLYLAYYCVLFSIKFSVWLVSGYAHVFVLVSVEQ